MALFLVFGCITFSLGSQAQESSNNAPRTIPRNWDEQALADLEVPLPNPGAGGSARPGVRSADQARGTNAQVLAAIEAVDEWARSGTRPEPSTYRADLGFIPDFVPPAWPQP